MCVCGGGGVFIVFVFFDDPPFSGFLYIYFYGLFVLEIRVVLLLSFVCFFLFYAFAFLYIYTFFYCRV